MAQAQKQVFHAPFLERLMGDGGEEQNIIAEIFQNFTSLGLEAVT